MTRQPRPIRSRTVLAALAAAVLVSILLPAIAGGDDALVVRANDAIGEPGGLVAVVLRTYASRPLGQGQICLQAGRQGGGGAPGEGPFASLESFRVFAGRRDALSVAGLETADGGQTIVLQFDSSSGRVNRTDGPLAVLYFRLRTDLAAGRRFNVRVDPAETLLFDAAGNPVLVEGRAGELRVRRPGARFRVEAEGDRVVPGEIADLGIETFEPFAVAGGQLALRWDPAVAAGPPQVRMDRRHGRRRFTVDASTPGLVVVTFTSPNASLNTVPGQLVSVRIPTDPATPVGRRSRVRIDRALSFLEDAEGDLLPLRLRRDLLEFEAD